MIFLDLPTELLCRILTYLPAVDLCAAQLTCRQINRIITETVYFQYTLRTYINGVDDFLPPDHPLHERIELLSQYEKSWNNLELNKSAEFPINVEAPNSNWFTLQDGYLIYKALRESYLPRRYGYLDLSSAIGNNQASWVHIPMEDSDMHNQDLTFAADHDLVISVRFCISPKVFLGAMPDKLTAHRWAANMYLHKLCLPSSSSLPGHPIPSQQTIPYLFPWSSLRLFAFLR